MNLRRGHLLCAAFALLIVMIFASAESPLRAQQRSVADGVYSAAQSGRGQRIYADTCASCHSADLSGGANLAGDVPSLAGADFVGAWSGATLGDLFERIRTMPQNAPGSLTAEQYTDVTAFILSKNSFPAGPMDLNPDPAALKAIRFEGPKVPVASAPEPDRSVLDGVYAEDQTRRGQAVYVDACATCHAAALTGADVVPALVGQDFLSKWTGATAGELFERIRTTMPQAAPGSLTAQQYADVLAYIFSRNRFPAGSKPLEDDVAALRMIRIETTKRK